MDKAEYHKLLAEIGLSGDWIGQEAEDTRRNKEQEVTALMYDKYGGLLVRGDAIHQFYMDTLRQVYATLGKRETQAILIYYTHWHLLSAGRYFAAFDLLRRGYYFECVTLARTLWETALTIAGLKHKIATFEELFGGKVNSDKPLPPAEILKSVKEVDSRIQNALLWKNNDLSSTAKEALNTFQWILNQATHKSNLGMGVTIERQKLMQGIHLFPYFDEKLTEMAGNILFLAVWGLMVTLSYLDELLPETAEWRSRYEKLLLTFDVLAKSPPNLVMKGFDEIIRKVFEIPKPASRVEENHG